MQTVRVDSIKPNPDNPRIIKDDQYARLLASIKRDPAFLEVRGIVHADGVVLGGNMRLRAVQDALKDATFREAVGVPAANVMPAAWVQDASAWDTERRRRFIIVDNSPDGLSGEWDWDALANEWDEDMLRECGLEPVADNTECEDLGGCDPKESKDNNILTCPKCGFRYAQD